MARVVEARPSRLRLERTADGLRVQLARRRTWWMFAMPAWIAFVFGFGLVSMLTGEPPENSGGHWFLVVWGGLGAAILSGSLWALLHREELLVGADTLTHVRRIGRLARRRAYRRGDIEDIRVSPEHRSPFDIRAGLRMYGAGGGIVAFDYGDRTIRVADVEEAEAKRVVAALREEGL